MERPTLVPDTNALLFNPSIENWTFPDLTRFVLVLTPAVLSELDEQKVNHRNPEVREKAERLIRQLKEYRRRGRLTDGVKLVHDAIHLVAVALEPDVSRSLPWLDPTNHDDRLIASTLDVMRRYSRSPVAIVTRDINLQNKAEVARIPTLEPPDP